MHIHELPKITEKRRKRLGMGHGSGRGKTAGRGTKGQKARYDIPLAFEGGALALIKRMPFLRGKGRNRSLYEKPLLVNLRALNTLPKNATVDVQTLIEKNLVSEDAQAYGVKIVGNVEVTTPLTITVPISKQAAEKIQAAGGQVTLTS